MSVTPYQRHADHLISGRLAEMETQAIQCLFIVQEAKARCVEALKIIQNELLWMQETYADGSPVHRTFDDYLDAFTERVRELHPELQIGARSLREALRLDKRMARGDMSLRNVLGLPIPVLRVLETVAEFDYYGNVLGLRDGLNEEVMPQDVRDAPSAQDAFDALLRAVIAIHNESGDHGSAEAMSFLRSLKNEPDVWFGAGNTENPRQICVFVVSHVEGEPYMARYGWDDVWPREAEDAYLKKLGVFSLTSDNRKEVAGGTQENMS